MKVPNGSVRDAIRGCGATGRGILVCGRLEGEDSRKEYRRGRFSASLSILTPPLNSGEPMLLRLRVGDLVRTNSDVVDSSSSTIEPFV